MQQGVVVDGAMSERALVLSDVPQGTLLGPLFFFLYMYINGITNEIASEIRLFADGCICFRHMDRIEDTINLKMILVA